MKSLSNFENAAAADEAIPSREWTATSLMIAKSIFLNPVPER
jgi:hypothetical protein